MDESRAPVVLEAADAGPALDRNLNSDFDISGAETRRRFREFFRNFRQGNIYPYRDALVRQWNRKDYFVNVDLAHVNEYDEVLFNNLQSRPEQVMPYFEAATKDALLIFLTEKTGEEIPEFQVTLHSAQLSHSLRSLNADLVNRLVKVREALLNEVCHALLSCCVSIHLQTIHSPC
jgi:DNA replication licensing factor MCM5